MAATKVINAAIGLGMPSNLSLTKRVNIKKKSVVVPFMHAHNDLSLAGIMLIKESL